MTQQNKNVPKLRFPEFNDPWHLLYISQISQKPLENGVFNDPEKVGSGYKLINVKDMYEGTKVNINKLTLLELDKKTFDKNKVEYGDIFFTRSSLVKEGIAHSNINLSYDEDITFDGHLIKMTPNKDIADPLFLSYLFKTSHIRKQFISKGKTATMTTIGQKDISTSSAALPKMPEQQKIADFLSAVDERVDGLRRKKELLERYKKGVMQKIFSQEIRFTRPDGTTYPDWKEKKLFELGDTYNGLTGKSGDDFGNGAKFITYKQVFDKSVIDISKCALVSVSSNEKQNIATYGDFFFTTSSEVAHEVGLSSVLLSNEKLYLNSFCFGFRPKSLNTFNPQFGQYLFRSKEFRKNVTKLAQGSTRYNISKVGFMKLAINTPHPDEQKAIADFLTSVDKKVEASALQLEEAQKFKKALLQQMFV